MDDSFKIGHRTLKTVAAVFFCLLLNFLFDRKEPFYAVIASILCIQPTIHKSMDIGVYRVIGTALGSIFCFFALWLARIVPYYSDYVYMFLIPLLTLAFIYLLNILHLKDSVPVATITFIVMIFTQKPEINGTLSYAVERTLDTIVGAAIGVLVNRYMFRKDWADIPPENPVENSKPDKQSKTEAGNLMEADDLTKAEGITEAEKLAEAENLAKVNSLAETENLAEADEIAETVKADKLPDEQSETVNGLMENSKVDGVPDTDKMDELPASKDC